jgi:transposase
MQEGRKIKRNPKVMRTGGQLALGLGIDEPAPGAAKAQGASRVVFNDPDPGSLFVGNERLSDFLRQMSFGQIFAVRELLRSLDLSAIMLKYKGGGRQPYHPAAMVGLILHGIMEGRSSLRELETLGRSDVRAWWLTGGVMPNYSVICRFINGNAEVLTEEFFEQLTFQILKRTASSGASVAVDGTVIQAAASRYKTIKREAAEQAATEARANAEANPEDQRAAERAAQAERVAEVAKERSAQREKQGRANKDAPVCPTEPDAVVQPLKTKAVAPGYKGSVAANDDRIITANAVHPTSETVVVPGLIDQTARTAEQRVEEVLEDAGYHTSALLNHAIENNINMLCPQGRTDGGPESWEKQSEKIFLKNQFRFDEQLDIYVCPAGQQLVRDHEYKGNDKNPAYVQYRCNACEDCHLRARCTKSNKRAVKRYQDDEVKEAMREVMSQRGAQRRYRQRQAMVEPVHGEMKHIQRLTRFHRRGLKQVRLEYSLHCAAHNLRRYVRLCARRLASAAGAAFGELGYASASLKSALICDVLALLATCGLLLGYRRPPSHLFEAA